MSTTNPLRFARTAWGLPRFGMTPGVVGLLITIVLSSGPACGADLKVMRTGLGSGTVTSNPAGITCGGACDATFGDGVTVTLTAAPASGSTFSHWEGDAAGTSHPVTVTMSEDRAVRAVV